MPKYRSKPREGGVQEVTLLDSGQRLAQGTFTCAHCNGVVVIPLRAKAEECGSFCMLCFRPTCAKKECQECIPFEKKLEAMEARSRLLAAIG